MVIYTLQTLNKSYIFPENLQPHKIPWPNNTRLNDPSQCLQKHYQCYLPHSFPFISHTFATIRLYVTSSVQFPSVQFGQDARRNVCYDGRTWRALPQTTFNLQTPQILLLSQPFPFALSLSLFWSTFSGFWTSALRFCSTDIHFSQCTKHVSRCRC